jgi:hypothetical protein
MDMTLMLDSLRAGCSSSFPCNTSDAGTLFQPLEIKIRIIFLSLSSHLLLYLISQCCIYKHHEAQTVSGVKQLTLKEVLWLFAFGVKK